MMPNRIPSTEIHHFPPKLFKRYGVLATQIMEETLITKFSHGESKAAEAIHKWRLQEKQKTNIQSLPLCKTSIPDSQLGDWKTKSINAIFLKGFYRSEIFQSVEKKRGEDACPFLQSDPKNTCRRSFCIYVMAHSCEWEIGDHILSRFIVWKDEKSSQAS
jgi:hypothetical protein